MAPTNVSPTERTLRIVTLFMFVPAISFLLPYGIEARNALPTIGIAPAAISACMALGLVVSKVRTRFANIVMDLFLVAFYLGCLIPGWLKLAGCCVRGRGLIMLGTYGTVPLMINLVLHIYLVLVETPVLHLLSSIFASPTCPHCQREIRAASSKATKESYKPLNTDENDPEASSAAYHDARPSTDDETAPLV